MDQQRTVNTQLSFVIFDVPIPTTRTMSNPNKSPLEDTQKVFNEMMVVQEGSTKQLLWPRGSVSLVRDPLPIPLTSFGQDGAISAEYSRTERRQDSMGDIESQDQILIGVDWAFGI